MIITCPACSTRYAVSNDAISANGRTVRCAKCRHSWHQDSPDRNHTNSASVPLDGTQTGPQPQTQPQTVPQPKSEPRRSPDNRLRDNTSPPPPPSPPSSPAPPPAPAPAPPPAPSSDIAAKKSTHHDTAFDDTTSQFNYEPPFRPRINSLKIWTIAGIVFAVIAMATVGAVSYYGLPNWVPVSRPTFAVAQPDLVLDFPADQQDRRTLPDGSEFFSASGTITNLGRKELKLPPILILMRDERDRVVYSWVVVPSKTSLMPGESITINEVAADVPKSAKFAEIGWKPD